MIEKIVHMAKHTVEAMMGRNSARVAARSCPGIDIRGLFIHRSCSPQRGYNEKVAGLTVRSSGIAHKPDRPLCLALAIGRDFSGPTMGLADYEAGTVPSGRINEFSNGISHLIGILAF
jgi:hypothetical protein